jgi:hypothetical protein
MGSTQIKIGKLMQDMLSEASDNPNLLDDLLREEGFNPEKLELDGTKKIKALMFTHQVAFKKARQTNLFEKALSMLKTIEAETKAEVLALLQQKAPSLQFRNLEKLDESTLREILSETEILDLMSKLEK